MPRVRSCEGMQRLAGPEPRCRAVRPGSPKAGTTPAGDRGSARPESGTRPPLPATAFGRLVAVVCIGASVSATGARADELRTVSDDRLTGRLVGLSDATVSFRHDSGRLLVLPVDAVAALKGSSRVVIHLANGDRMVGTIERVSPEEWLVHSPLYGDQVLRREEIADITGEEAEPPVPANDAHPSAEPAQAPAGGAEPPAGGAEPPAQAPATATGVPAGVQHGGSGAAAVRRAPRPARRQASPPPSRPDRAMAEAPAMPDAAAAAVTGRGGAAPGDEAPDGATGEPSQEQAPAAPSGRPSQEPAPEGSELLFLRQQAVLLPERGVETDVSLSYLRNRANERNDTAVILSPTVRFNVLPELEGFVTVPVQWAQRQVDLVTELITDENAGFGDVQFGLKYNLITETLDRPFVVISASATAPTGDAPYFRPPSGYNLADIRNPLSAPFGTGHWSTTFGVTLIKSFDPIVVFGTIDYTHTFPETYYGVEIAPGDRYGFNAGFGFAISEYSTIGAQIFAQFQRPWTFNGVEVHQTEALPLSLRLSYTHRLAGYTAIEPSITFGLVEDATDALLSLGFTYRF